jgi:hypothetical protein
MLDPTDTAMAMACWPSDSGFAAGELRIKKGACGSRGGHRLSLHAARCGSALFRNFTVVAPVKLQLSTSLLNLNITFVKGLMAINDSSKCGLDFPIGRRPWGSGPGYDSKTTLSRNITMAFVNENIPEADLQRIDFASVIHPLHSCPIEIPSEWSIDRERDIALISLGGGSGENSMYPSFFLIYWQGQFTDVHLVARTTGSFTTWDLEVTWTLRFLRKLNGVPESLFLEILKEALTCYGYMDVTLRDRVKAVKFNFDHNIIIRG